MNNFIFENSTKVFFGKGCVKEYLCCLTKAYGDTVMLCYGGGSIKKNGIYDEVTNILEAAGKTVVEFSGIMANPTYAKVLEGAKLAKKNDVSLLLGIGGGSVMDCCKAISIAARYDGDVWEDFWKRPGVFDFEPLPLGVIVVSVLFAVVSLFCLPQADRARTKQTHKTSERMDFNVLFMVPP